MYMAVITVQLELNLINKYNFELAKELANIKNDCLSIGERSEHSLHRIIKYMIDPSSLNHEKKISNKIVDICIENNIYAYGQKVESKTEK